MSPEIGSQARPHRAGEQQGPLSRKSPHFGHVAVTCLLATLSRYTSAIFFLELRLFDASPVLLPDVTKCYIFRNVTFCTCSNDHYCTKAAEDLDRQKREAATPHRRANAGDSAPPSNGALPPWPRPCAPGTTPWYNDVTICAYANHSRLPTQAHAAVCKRICATHTNAPLS